MERTISITELQNSNVNTWSVKDNSPRGCHTAYTSELKPGDKVVIDNYFTTVTEAAQEAEPTTEATESSAKPFPHLSNLLYNEYVNRRLEASFFVECGYYPHWSEEHQNDRERGLKQYSTEARWKAYQAGKITREKAVELATRRALLEVAKNEAIQQRKLKAAAAAPALEWCEIAVEWVRNSYWGNNPRATARANNTTTQGRASGCGYDKQSAAIAEALNNNPAALRVLYEAAEKALSDGKKPYRTTPGSASGCVSWADILGYGSGYSIVPYFEGGCGVSTIQNIFTGCGFAFRCGASSRHYDSYSISRKA